MIDSIHAQIEVGGRLRTLSSPASLVSYVACLPILPSLFTYEKAVQYLCKGKNQTYPGMNG